MRSTTWITMVALGVAITSPALAAGFHPIGHPEARVSLAGVDFRDSGAVGDLYVRLKWAAENACRSGYRAAAYAAREERACVRETVEAVVRKADRPMLTAAHNASGLALANGY